jgi:hypothetical protein
MYNALGLLKITSGGGLPARFLIENSKRQILKENFNSFGQTVSIPQGYQDVVKAYVPTIKASSLIRAVLRGEGTLINTGIRVPVSMSSTVTGVGNLSPDIEVGKTCLATVTGVGTVSGDPRTILRMSAALDAGVRPSAFDIAQEIWQSQKTTYNAPGTMGSALNSASTGSVDYNALGQAVWDILLVDMNLSGSAGERIKQLLTQSKFIALKD